MRILLFAGIISLASGISAQTFQVVWEKSYGGSLTNSQEFYCTGSTLTTDNCILAIGYTNSNDGIFYGNHGGFDIVVIKLNQNGDTIWTKLLGGTMDDKGYDIEATPDSGCIIAATTYSTSGQISINYGGYDYWIVKLNSNGDIQWEKSYGGSEDDYAKSIKPTSDGNYIVTGWTFSNNGFVHGLHGFYEDIWTLKLNSVGDTIWTKCFGGSGWDYGNDIVELPEGNYVLSAELNDSHDGDIPENNNGGVESSWLAKLDTAGNIHWSRNFGDNYLAHAPLSLISTYNDGFVFLDNQTLPDYSRALSIYNFDPNGDTIWTKKIITTYAPLPYAYTGTIFKLLQTTDSNLIVLAPQCFLCCYDSIHTFKIFQYDLLSGDSLWTIDIGDTLCSPSSILEVANNTFVVSGEQYTDSTSSFYFLKFKMTNAGENLKKLKKLNFSVYPNPSSGKFIIELQKNHEPVYITISNNNGNILFIDKIIRNKTFYDFSGKLPEGIYYLTLSNKHTLSTKKIIIQ